MRYVVLSLLSCFLLLSAASAPAEEEWSRPYHPFLPGTEPLGAEGKRTVVAVRVLAGEPYVAEEARPVAGALVSCHTEASHASDAGAKLLAMAKTDRYGFANVPGPCEDGYHWHFDAPGIGIAHEFSRFPYLDEEVWIRAGKDWQFRILSPFGKPLAEASVETYLGCPHSPAARSGVTDAEGLITLRDAYDFNDTLWVVAPGVHPGPYALPERYVRDDLLGEEDGPPELITDPAPTVTGIVLDPQGRPVEGAVMRSPVWKRGPVTVTDAEGRFVLHGVDPDSPLVFYHPTPRSFEVPGCVVRAFHEDIPLRVVLRPDRPTALAEGEPCFPVNVLAWPEKTPVRLTRLSDGFTVAGKTGEAFERSATVGMSGCFSADLPRGKYRLEVGGGFSRAALAWKEISVPVPGGQPVKMKTKRQPELWIADVEDLEEGVELGLRVSLRIPGREISGSAIQLARDAHLPAEGPAWLLFHGPRPYLVEVGELRDRLYDVPRDHRPVLPVPPEPHCVRFRIRSDRPGILSPEVWGFGLILPEPVNGEDRTFEFDTHLAGTHEFGIEAEGHGSARVSVDLPGADARRIDLGEVTLELPDETSVVPPRGRLRINIRSPGGELLPGVAYVDARREEASEGACEFDGLAGGACTVIVGARGHVGEVRRLVLGEGEIREITLRLPPR